MDASPFEEPARDAGHELPRRHVVVLSTLQGSRVRAHEELSLALGIQDFVPDELGSPRRDEDVAGLDFRRNVGERGADLAIEGGVALSEVVEQALEARGGGDCGSYARPVLTLKSPPA